LTNLHDTFTVGAGDHVINGMGGNDTITAGAGNSTINVGDGNDTITAGAGNSIVSAGDGNNTITAGAGNSTINAGDGNDTITAGAGASTVNAQGGNNTITTGAGDSIISAGEGDNVIATGAGNNTVTAGNGVNTIATGAGNSNILAGDGHNTIATGAGNSRITAGNGGNIVATGAGNNTITTGAGNDIITTAAGDDAINAGAGSDAVYALAGKDVLIYVAAENKTVGTNDFYDGGAGSDTLRLVLTRAEWMDTAVQADIAKYLAFVTANTGAYGEDSSASYTFSAFGLTANNMEKLEVTVDGIAIDPANHAVTLHNDAVSTSENVAAAVVNVLANDSVPDLINSLTFTDPSHGSVQLTAAYAVTADAPSASFVYTPNAGFYDYLAVGESAKDTFTYTVTDASGDVKTATVDVTITGSNDKPIITTADLSGAVTEQVMPVGGLTDSGSIAFTDLDLTDVHLVSINDTSVASNLGALTATLVTDTTSTGAGGELLWNYAVADSVVEYLAKDETRVESFTITLDDRNGGVTTKQIDVTITGSNDAPVVATTDVTGTVTEMTAPGAAMLTDTGTIAFTDVDLTDDHSLSTVTSSAGALGTLTASVSTDSTGSGTGGQVNWNYSVADSAVEYLAAGQIKVETFSFNVLDGHGASVARTVSVTVTGTNDAPAITTADLTGSIFVSQSNTSSVGLAYLNANQNLVNTLGGARGFGENTLAGNGQVGLQRSAAVHIHLLGKIQQTGVVPYRRFRQEG
jgi:VCBS repeat-containing protein